MADTFEHTPQVWTAGRLRSVLAGLPDDTPIHVGVADAPGDFDAYGEFVLVDAEPVEVDLTDLTDLTDFSYSAGSSDSGLSRGGDAAPEVRFTLFADAKAGVYHLDVD
ncbi:DUF6225 family protein [Streptomyces sp. H27-G5]|uniref:DUF6225 family protein n=1 Tax=Streptomyces sp. H27-G5 TaxID=2996698 RepID=UPI002271DCA3|nr:DUF6225 family protein [Streptomyces sp. H27-G5]MCY0918504.1 DUF6225 family protein [Streptomyces sp. H27-G5]